MSDHTLDPGVVIRSMASRGSMGGIAPATYQAAVVFDAMGFETVVIETVGTGQLETDIVRCAHTVVVVTMPGTGDEVQVAKAGLFEIGDVFVVNKADRDGADAIHREIQAMLALGNFPSWVPPVLLTTASQGTGVEEVAGQVEGHHAARKASGRFRQDEAARARHIILEEVVGQARERARHALGRPAGQRLVRQVAARHRDAASAARLLAKGR
jgi:LAO/AO transport system kinase